MTTSVTAPLFIATDDIHAGQMVVWDADSQTISLSDGEMNLEDHRLVAATDLKPGDRAMVSIWDGVIHVCGCGVLTDKEKATLLELIEAFRPHMPAGLSKQELNAYMGQG